MGMGTSLQVEKEVFDLDSGKRNLGFKYSEAMMESVDDSFDASFWINEANSGNRVEINIYEDDYEELIHGEIIASKRYSYEIIDNGPGANVDNIFNFGKNKEERFSSLYALNTLNGLFHYGMSSHLNVGNRLYFYSRQDGSEWWMNCIESSEVSDEVFSFKRKEEPVVKLGDKHLNLDDPNFFVRTVVQVKGVRKSEVEVDNINVLIEKLLKQFGITYRHYIESGNKILINGTEVKAIDPFLQNVEFIERGIESELFHSFEIKLSELLQQEDAIVKSKIIRRYSHLFKDEKDLLNQTIEIRMYHLNLKFIKTGFKNEIAGEVPNCLLPSPEYSGFYIKRNMRYIGRAAKILDICTEHNSFNYFRSEISFAPIFDEFFGIQVNKNRYDIKSSLASLIIEKIDKKIKVKLSTYLDKYKKNNKTKSKPISLESKLNIINQKVNKNLLHLDTIRAKAQEDGIDTDLINETAEIISILQDLSSSLARIKVDAELVELDANSIINNANDILSESEQIIARVQSAISLRNECLIYPANILKERVIKAYNNRRLLVSKDLEQTKDFQGYILEPLNEVQLYGVLSKMLHYYPSEFDFILLDYNENKSLDCLVKLKEKELYNNLSLKLRFENQWDYNWDEYLLNEEGAFSFVELKYLLGEKEDLGHSMSLVSHLICWDYHPSKIDEFTAVDGKYKLSMDRNYLFHTNKMKKIKVICLRELVEELLDGEFTYSEEYFNSYINL